MMTENVDDSCGLQSIVTWSSTAGATYHIQVTGYQSGNTGTFTLTVDGTSETLVEYTNPRKCEKRLAVFLPSTTSHHKLSI